MRSNLNMFEQVQWGSVQWVSTVGLYKLAGPCMVGTPPTPVDRMTDWWTDTTENITFASPLAGGSNRPKLIIRAMGWLISEPLTKPRWIHCCWKCSTIIKIQMRTRMHSSRMRTARSLTVSRSICHVCPPPHTPPYHALVPCHACPLPHIPPCHTCPPPPWTEFLTHASENITFPELRCGR